VICLVTDRARFDVPSTVRAAARDGVDLVQVRERDLDDRALLALVRRVIAEVAGTPARVLVNDRLDVALAAGAHGVHLRGDSIAASRVRAMAPRGFLVGRSVHALDEAIAIDREGAVDYVIFGTVFASAGKPAGHPVAGVEALARVCAAVRTPVLAIGGIDAARAVEARRAGAQGVAAIGLFAGAGAREAIRDIRRTFDTGSQVV
jgi:thiamine-phosphate pyrophosphorylase